MIVRASTISGRGASGAPILPQPLRVGPHGSTLTLSAAQRTRWRPM
jgi:hypothetical protein